MSKLKKQRIEKFKKDSQSKLVGGKSGKYSNAELKHDIYPDSEKYEYIILKLDSNDFGTREIRKSTDSITKSTRELKFFVDGARSVFYIDEADIYIHKANKINRKILPINAAQISATCCTRENKKMHSYIAKCEQITIFPWDGEKAPEFCGKENGISVWDVYYSVSGKQDAKTTANDKAQQWMTNLEEQITKKAIKREIEQNHNKNFYLVNDGDIPGVSDLEKPENKVFQHDYFLHIIGLAKSFDHNSSLIKTLNEQNKEPIEQGNVEHVISGLENKHRTNIVCRPLGKKFILAEWFLRIRDNKETKSTFEGVVKIQKVFKLSKYADKMLSDDDKKQIFKEVNTISALILKEAYPTCYGRDHRWPNHIYPIYLTEQFSRSLHESKEKFLAGY